MSNGDLLELLVKRAKSYRECGVADSIKRNAHMNEYRGEPIPEAVSDAVLTDFINYVGVTCGMDLGLYSVDLKPEAARDR